ncbi:hypothetical protein [Leptospira mayottensis]|uniref:Lipoprotein n=2 Tax=Leptospira mayottensis TaxID=1137606 RepID=A0AA87MRF8_9LEPT|nr:hypothetical protein [Leptospira mayottensis]AXR61092.1 hypothetical protein DQM68_10765 [Leptospira mayottensis]AXR65654.1 hypothetical protein DQM28_16960 [Leptospira mayottensis]AXR68637.1 hypothetical protein DPV73_12075 [Leptospira mayottensis]AZQ02471.1 hypothetical protein LEP1GSC190_10930 [Leptospira mayottensis 200901116]EKS01268.1 hypothetical protein LEP1GSC125_0563 [Leptospira mayottensis 200901122]
MSKKIERCTTFLAMLGLSAVLFCSTVMLSGNHCPTFVVSNQTTEQPCHQSERTNDSTDNTCSACNLFVSSESVHPKTPELGKNYFSVFTAIQNYFHFTLGIFFSQRNSYDRNPNYNVQKFIIQLISTVRLLI